MSDMKCPFCGRKLGRKNINDRMCSNEKCVSWKGNFYGSEDLWQALIQAKQDLEIATEALKDILIVRCGLEDFEPKAVTMTRIAENAIERITRDISEKANSGEQKE